LQVIFLLTSYFCPKDKKESAHYVIFSELYLNSSYSLQTSTSQNSYDKPLSVEDYLKIGKEFCDSLGLFMVKKFSVRFNHGRSRKLAQTCDRELKNYGQVYSDRTIKLILRKT